LLSSTFSINQYLARHMKKRNKKTKHARHMTNLLEDFMVVIFWKILTVVIFQKINDRKNSKDST